jgi:hypothetical protein
MLSGRPPYEASTPVALAAAHAEPPAPLTASDPTLAIAIERALAPEPSDRFPDVAAFAAALDPSLGTASADARTTVIPAVAESPAPAAVGHRTAIAAGALALGLAAFVALAALEPDRPSSPVVEQPAQAATAAPVAEPDMTPLPTQAPAARDSDGDGGKAKGKDNGKGKGKGGGKGKGD